jgi:hypothetical protein
MNNFRELSNQIFEQVVHEMYLKGKKEEHIKHRLNQISSIKQKRKKQKKILILIAKLLNLSSNKNIFKK